MASFSLLAVSASAHANDAADPATSADTSTPEAVEVTAPVVEIPQWISVITDLQMRERGIHDIEEAARYTAGARGGGSGEDSRSDWLLVRGFTSARFAVAVAVHPGFPAQVVVAASGPGVVRLQKVGSVQHASNALRRLGNF